MLYFAVGNAALVALSLERMGVAEQLFNEQLEILRRERLDGLWDEPTTGLACVAAHAGDAERAATIIGWNETMPGLPENDGDRQLRERLVARFVAPARAALGERAWKRAAVAGSAMTPDELCEFAHDRRAAVALRAATPGNR